MLYNANAKTSHLSQVYNCCYIDLINRLYETCYNKMRGKLPLYIVGVSGFEFYWHMLEVYNLSDSSNMSLPTSDCDAA